MHIIFSVLIIGLSGITAQVLLLRELLVSFSGNELTLGIILANWVILEALGVFIFGRLIDRAKNKINVFILLEITFSLILPLSIFFSRAFKGLLGIPFAEAIGLGTVFSASFLVILPAAFIHGALFSVSAKLYSLSAKEPAHSLGRVYAWETAGTIIGGIALTYLFIPRFNSFQITYLVSLANLFIAATFVKYEPDKKIKYINLVAVILIFLLLIAVKPDSLHRYSISKQWKGQQVLDYRNSLYGNIVVTKREGQNTFFYNGTPIITTPYPDITFVEEFAHLPLLFHPAPADILIVSAGAGGLIYEILKHPVREIDYAELDPLIIKKLREYPSKLTEHELKDARVKVINLDGRFFLKRTSCHYDIILIGLSRPADLSTNRLFTQEFFSLAKKRLNPEGILGIWLPGSLAYLGKELRDLNACILNAMRSVYQNVRIIPGDYNIILASDGALDISADRLAQKIKELNLKTNILTPAYLDYRLNKRWLDWFNRSSLGATRKTNRDLAPFAVFKMLIFWNKEFSPAFARILGFLEGLNLKIILALVLAFTLWLFYSFRRKARLSVAYTIATTGFFGMTANLLLIFGFQVFYGCLYYILGLLISIFMAGIAAGSIFMTKKLPVVKNKLKTLIGLEVAVILFTYIMALVLARGLTGYPVFLVLFFVAGFLMGLEFPLAAGIYLPKIEKVGETAGALYAADLAGGWLAGISTGIIFLPILGFFNTCLVIILLKLSSVFLLSQSKR